MRVLLTIIVGLFSVMQSYAADPDCYLPAFTCKGKVQNASGIADHNLRLLKVNRDLPHCTYVYYDFYFLSVLKYDNGQSVQNAVGMFDNDRSGNEKVLDLGAVSFPAGRHLDVTAKQDESTGVYEGKVIDGWNDYFSGDISCLKAP